MTVMPNKTDNTSTKRNRVRYECKPKLQTLFDLMNILPPLGELNKFNPPDKPLLRGIDKERDFNFIYKTIEKGLALIEYLRKQDIEIYRAIIRNNEDEILFNLYNAYNEKLKIFKDRLNNCSSSKEILLIKDELDFESAEVLKARHEFTNYGYEICMKWFDILERLKLTKSTLQQLAFTGKDLKYGKRYLTPFSIAGLNGLLSNSFYIDENGIFKFRILELFRILEGVDVRRIRTCAEKDCKNFFWAQRIDRMCCSKKCADTYNQYLSRERKRERRNLYTRKR